MKYAIADLCYSKDGKIALVISNNELHHWDLSSGKRINCLTVSKVPLAVIALKNKQNGCLIADVNGIVYDWDLTHNKVIKQIKTDVKSPLFIESSPNDNNFLLIGRKVLEEWNIDSAKKLISIKPNSPQHFVKAIYFNNGKDALVACKPAGETVAQYNLTTGTLIKKFAPDLYKNIYDIQLSNDGKTVLVANAYSLSEYNLDDYQLTRRVPGRCNGGAVYSSGDKFILTAHRNGSIKMLDRKTGTFINSFQPHLSFARKLRMSPTAPCFLSYGGERLISETNYHAGTPVIKWPNHLGRITDSTMNRKMSRAVTASDDYTIKYWNTTNWTIITDIKLNNKVTAIIMSTDCSQAAAGLRNGEIIECNLKTGKITRKLNGHHGYIRGLSYINNDLTLISIADDGSAKLWNASNSKPIFTLKGHLGGLLSLAVSPDQTRASTGGRDGYICEWDLQTGKRLHKILAHRGDVVSLVYSNDGSSLTSVGQDGYKLKWTLPEWTIENAFINGKASTKPRPVLTPRSALWEDEIDTKDNHTFGATSTFMKQPIGGGKGYKDTVTTGDYTVNNLVELTNALKNATDGQIIFIPTDTEICFDDTTKPLTIPAGVTLASDRGLNGSEGAMLYSNKLRNDGAPLLKTAGELVRITGIRLRGPHPERSKIAVYSFGISITHFGVEVDNCDISGFATSAINIFKAARVYIHHNHIHHNQQSGLGYGIQIATATALIEANHFDWCRHHIASGGTSGTGYEARYNKILGNANGFAFDMHGGTDRGDDTDIAGDWMNIHHNTFALTSPLQYNIGIRGIPNQSAIIHHNWFLNPDSATTVFVIPNTYGNSIKNQVMWLMMPFNGEANTWAYKNVFGPLAQPLSDKTMINQSLQYRSRRLANKDYLKLSKEDMADIILTLLRHNEYKKAGLNTINIRPWTHQQERK
jgi:WD40 repeat protein